MTHNHALPILTTPNGRTWWRSLEELADTQAVHDYLHREFPENASEWLSGSRRDFLRLLGASLFLAGASGCDIKQPSETIVPTVSSADHAPPGLPVYFTTAMDFAGSATGLTVQTRDGRPIKIEGNANHPASLGATGVFAQAATLDLYDPDRPRAPALTGQLTSIEHLRETINALRTTLDQDDGRGLRLLIGTSTSPTLARLLRRISKRWPKSKWFVYESLSEAELLAMLCEDAESGYAAVRKSWKEQLGEDDGNPSWQKAVANGVIEETEFEGEKLTLHKSFSRLDASPDSGYGALANAKTAEHSFEIVYKPDPTIWDGRFANNGWLQELPKPLSHIVWDNTAWMAPADAARLQLTNGDVVSFGADDKTIQLPVWIMPGHAEGCLSLFTGYGRTLVGRVGKGTGVSVYALRTLGEVANAFDAPPKVLTISATGKRRKIVTTQHHQMMEGRDLARAGSLVEYLQQPDNPPFAHPPSPAPDDSFYENWPYQHDNKWGMTIDLTACVGCSACVIACQAENNIPVVGKEQCGNNRHMHWIRVHTYYQGPPEQPTQTLSQPVPCMQCERAPCEVVCPVAATNHSDDGLNQMIYNRCVGTRYCSNNCPYKVRRFNFLDFSDDFITDPSLHLLSNPEVTMRSRGVMEKCTYCVQRIEQARIAAQLEDRDIRDGDIKTACQAVCPAQAIRFGDLNDPESDEQTIIH